MRWRSITDRDLPALRASQESAAIFGRDDLVAVVASGKHRHRFLHAVTTQRVENQGLGRVLVNTLCTAQGALRGAWLQVIEEGRDVLWTERSAAPKLIEQLLSYRVAERVKLEIDESLSCVELVGPRGAEIMKAVFGVVPSPGEPRIEQDGTPSLDFIWRDFPVRVWWRPFSGLHEVALEGYCLQFPTGAMASLAGALMEAGAVAGCLSIGEVLRVRAARPRLSCDLVEGSTPMEMGLRASVHLSKGCYLGHEALAMQTWRGQLRRHLCWVEVLGDKDPIPGESLRSGGRRAGWAASGYRLPAGESVGLAVIQRRHYEPGAELESDSGARLRVVRTTELEVWAS